MTTVADATVHVCLDFRQICMHDTETFTGSVCMPKFTLLLGQCEDINCMLRSILLLGQCEDITFKPRFI